MKQTLRALAAAGGLLGAILAAAPALAQKQGGVLRIPVLDSPASMSIHEESAVIAQRR